MDRSADIAIVGAGIVGLAHAYMALRKGLRVVLFEREQYATGASIRNFGLLWPIGQEPGTGLDRALRSVGHWNEISKAAGFWTLKNGSLHLAYHDDEMEVLEEFASLYRDAPYDASIVSPAAIHGMSPVVRADGLKGGLYSRTEGTVYSREAIRRIPLWLEERFGLILKFGHVVTEVALPRVRTAREEWRVNKVIICSGADFETLYPEIYDQQPLVKCRLQMMKAVASQKLVIGPSLCAGLTLRHYAAFNKCPSLSKLNERYDRMNGAYREHGVHVLLSQNQYGELIIGDSHHYNHTIEPFDSPYVDTLIMDYLNTFADLGTLTITEKWNGTYAKVQSDHCIVIKPGRDVTIVNGLGGAGMTLSFGLAEEVIEQL